MTAAVGRHTIAVVTGECYKNYPDPCAFKVGVVFGPLGEYSETLECLREAGPPPPVLVLQGRPDRASKFVDVVCLLGKMVGEYFPIPWVCAHWGQALNLVVGLQVTAYRLLILTDRQDQHHVGVTFSSACPEDSAVTAQVSNGCRYTCRAGRDLSSINLHDASPFFWRVLLT